MITMAYSSYSSNASLRAHNASCQNYSSNTEAEQEEENPAVFSIPLIAFLAILGLLIVAINGLVIYLTHMKKALRSPTNMFLTSLAVLDLITGFVGVPVVVICHVKDILTVCVFSTIFIRFAAISSICHVILIAADRYIAIVHSLQHGSLVTKWRAIGATLFVWLLSFVASIIQMSWYRLEETALKDYAVETEYFDARYVKACLVVFFAIPLWMICYMYGHIFFISYKVYKSVKNNRYRSSSLQQPQRSLLHEWRGRSVLLIMVVIFAGCWLPFFLAVLGDHKPSLVLSLSTLWVQRLLSVLTFIPPLLNPVLCTMAKKDFRRALAEVAFRKKVLRQRNDNFPKSDAKINTL